MRQRILWITFFTTMTFWLGCAGQGGGEKNYKVLEEDQQRFSPEPPNRGPESRGPWNLLQSAQAQPYNRYPVTPQSKKPPTTAPAPTTPAAPAASATPPVNATQPSSRARSTPPPSAQAQTYHRYPYTPQTPKPPATEPDPEPPVVYWTQPSPSGALPVTNLPGKPVPTVFGVIELTGSGTRAAASAPAPVAPPPGVPPSLVGLQRAGWPRVVVTPENGRTQHNPVYFVDAKSWADQFSTATDKQTTEQQLTAALDHSSSKTYGDVTTGKGNTVDLLLQPFKFAYDLVTLPVNAVIEPPLKRVETPPQAK
ncbi:MAG: hypothetical protein NTW19_04455 [Planctomycetota bacterium]|nr:hypothetical protein [Planctomycetota bacterium]